MSTPNIAPGKWSISPAWVTGEGTSEGFGAGYGSENYYYYKPKRAQATAEPKAETPLSIDEKFKDLLLQVDWSQKAVDTHALTCKTERVLAEAKRLKEK